MFGFKKIDHGHMALLVRNFGPELFDKLIAVKLSGPLQELNTRESKVQFRSGVDRTTVLERDDLSRAVRSRAYLGTELLLLRYMLSSIRRVGHFAGLERFACLPYGDTSGYYVISADEISSYDGSMTRPKPVIDHLELALVWLFVSGSLSLMVIGLACQFSLLLVTLVPCVCVIGYFYAKYIAGWAAERRCDSLLWGENI